VRASCAPVSARFQRSWAVLSGWRDLMSPGRRDAENLLTKRVSAYGAAPESNRPSRGLHDRTGFEDQLGHRAHAAPNPGYQADFAVSRASSTALGLPLVYPERPQRVIPSRCFDQPVRHQVPVDTERDARIGVAGVDPPARHAQANASSAGLRSGSPNAFAQGQRSLLQCHSGGGPRSIPRLSPVASAKRSLDRQRGVAAALSHGAHGVLLLECEPGRQ
jgi:hypothetical protein